MALRLARIALSREDCDMARGYAGLLRAAVDAGRRPAALASAAAAFSRVPAPVHAAIAAGANGYVEATEQLAAEGVARPASMLRMYVPAPLLSVT